MTNYIGIHDIGYRTDFPLSVIETILLSLNFVKATENDHLTKESSLHNEKIERFNHEKCGAIIAFANQNGGYGHYGNPQTVNLIELIVWHENNFDDCKILANKIAKQLNWQVYFDE